MRSDPELRQLRAFVAVAEQGGFTKAARALGVSQSTASEAVAALERALGTPVFVKGRRALTLTPAGDALLPRAREVLAAMEGALAAVAETSARAKGTVAVGTNESVSAYVLPEVLTALRARYANVRFDVATAVCSDVRAGLTSGRFDVGLVVEPERAPRSARDADEQATTLAPARLVVFGRPGSALAGRASASPGQLWDRPFYLSDAAGSFTGVLRRWVRAAGFDAERLHSIGSVEGVKRSVAADPHALGVLPAHALRDELRAGAIAELRLTPPLPPVVLKALLPPRITPAPVVRELVEGLRAVELE